MLQHQAGQSVQLFGHYVYGIFQENVQFYEEVHFPTIRTLYELWKKCGLNTETNSPKQVQLTFLLSKKKKKKKGTINIPFELGQRLVCMRTHWLIKRVAISQFNQSRDHVSKKKSVSRSAQHLYVYLSILTKKTANITKLNKTHLSRFLLTLGGL